MQFPMKIFFFIFEIFPFFQRLFLLSTEDTTIQTNKQTLIIWRHWILIKKHIKNNSYDIILNKHKAIF